MARWRQDPGAAVARRPIEKHRYLCRKEELEDAEAAINQRDEHA